MKKRLLALMLAAAAALSLSGCSGRDKQFLHRPEQWR